MLASLSAPLKTPMRARRVLVIAARFRRALSVFLLLSIALHLSAPALQAATAVPACGFAEVVGVVTAGDTGLPLAEIEVVGVGGETDSDTETDASGNYTLTLPVYRDPGPYTISFTPPNDSPYISPAPANTQVISGGTTIVDAVLPLGGVIQGRVTTADTDQPMEDVRIAISGRVQLEDNDPMRHATNTDEEGRYRLQGLIGGEYVIKFDPHDFPVIPENAPYQDGYVGGAIYPAEATGFDVSIGEVITVDIDVPLGGTLGGVVRRGDVITPATDVQVDIYLVDEEEGGRGDFVQADETNEAGVYEFDGLAPGDYLLYARPIRVGFGPPSPNVDLKPEWHNNAISSTAATIIEIPAVSVAQAISVDIMLEPGAVITGHVTDADSGAPVEGIGLDRRPPIGESEVTRTLFNFRTDASGQYTLPALYAGSYGLLWDPGFGPYQSIGRNQFTGITMTVAATGVYPNVNFTVQKGGEIEGTLTGGQGTPLAEIQVSLISVATGRVVRTESSNASGEYSFSNVTPGEYNIRYDRYVPCGCYNNEFYEEDGDENGVVIVQADETTSGIDANLACNAPPPIDLSPNNELYLPRVSPHVEP